MARLQIGNFDGLSIGIDSTVALQVSSVRSLTEGRHRPGRISMMIPYLRRLMLWLLCQVRPSIAPRFTFEFWMKWAAPSRTAS